MKRYTFYLLLFVFPLMSSTCGDDDDPGAGRDDLPGALVANIDGQTIDFRYQPRAKEGTAQYGDDIIFDAIFINGATSVDYSKELRIEILNPAVGSFDIDPSPTNPTSGVTYSQIFSNGTGIDYYIINGTINVTELGNRIKGTFSGTMSNIDGNEIPIEGSFDLEVDSD